MSESELSLENELSPESELGPESELISGSGTDTEEALMLRRLMNQRLNGPQVVRQTSFQLPTALSLVVQSMTVLQQIPVMTLSTTDFQICHSKKSNSSQANHRNKINSTFPSRCK